MAMVQAAGSVRIGAVAAALALLAGVLAVQCWPRLPPLWCDGLGMAVALWLGWRFPRVRLVAVFAFGLAWAAWHGQAGMAARLPWQWEGRDFDVTGRVASLPLARSDATGFELWVEQASLDGRPLPLHGRLRLSWYGAPPLAPCTRWRLRLRLKRPRGLLDPGGADSERTALERGIVAVGYVRGEGPNLPLAMPFCIDRLREAVSRGIAARVADRHDAALLQAFSVGDTRGLSEQDWEVARANGIPHLIAISGFHVGVAAMFGATLARALYALLPALGLRWPRPLAESAASLLAAGAYTGLAGFGLPTVRTLLMIAMVAVARCRRRAAGGARTLALALAAILLADPSAVLAAGFWLSFVGVAFLMLCLDGRGRGLGAFLHELSVGQWVMTVSLLPLTMWFFGEASLVGALSNLVAVPFVSFVIVPAALLGTSLLALCPPLAGPALRQAAYLAHAQWWLLARMAQWPGAHWYLPQVRPAALLLASLGAAWLFAPRGLALRWLGLLLFLPLVCPPRSRLAEGAFQAWVLDVGQGLSVLVRTRSHALLYDAGARYPSGFDLGEAVVLPSLHAVGVDRLDALVISHGDNDHAGGARAVAAAYPDALRYTGEPERMSLPFAACVVGQAWTWDGVRIRVLWPRADGGVARDNDRSCVLLVEGRSGRLLLTGDVGAQAESRVAEALGPPRMGTALLVPHHGSRSSSSASFIAAVQPVLAVVSTGWRNHFGHPHPLVVQRYAQAGVPLFDTAASGAVALDFPVDGPPRVSRRWRHWHRRYWRE